MTRRSPGEGTVYQRSNGKWAVEVPLPKNHLGKRRRRKRIAATKREAERLRRRLLADLEAGRVEVDSSITVSQWCQRWLETGATLTAKNRTIDGYRYVLNRWVLPHVGHHQLRSLRADQIEAMLANLLDAGLSTSTARQARQVISTALGHAVRVRLLTHNPVRDTKAPRFEGSRRPPIKALSEEQAKQLVAACVSYQDVDAATFATLGVMLGMRRGEILGLRLGDIELEAGHLSIRQALNQNYRPTVDGAWMTELGMTTPKTPHSRRTLHLPPAVRHAVQRLIDDRERRRAAAGDQWEEHGLLFCSRHGKPMWPTHLVKRFKRLLDDVGLPPVAPHSLRHTFATVCLLNEIPAEHVQEAAGHSKVETTKDIYANYLPDLATKAIDALGRILDPDADPRRLRVVGSEDRKGA